MPPTLHRQAQVWTRICLICLGFGGIGRGLAYLPSVAFRSGPIPSGIALISEHGNLLTAWAGAWIFGGLVSIAAAFFREPKPIGTAGVVGLTYVWGVAYFAAWALALPDAERDWLGSLTYVVFATVLVGGAVLARVALTATSRKA